MRFSTLFTKTRKDAPKDEIAKNAQLLIKAGFIHKEMAGVYSYLPLGKRVQEKIISIVREEMNKIGGQELVMTSLQKREVWEITDRWDDEKVDVWFKSKLKNDTEVGFGWSHEEQITAMMKDYISSYRDLPANVYQFQTKLRNEVRAKSGVMRTREFVMKDLYSYSRTDKEHDEFYNKVIEAYHTIYNRLGIGDSTFLTFASGGAFTQFSHEFQTLTEAGEDTIYLHRDKKIAINEEVLTDEVLSQLEMNREELEKVKAAEVGNIFGFGTSKCEQIGLYYSDKDGTQKPVVLGSYGIGITRVIGVIVELFSDEKGLVWPEKISPYTVHLVSLAGEDENVKNRANEVYGQLTAKGIEVLFDDRDDVPAGQKFSDADLIGIPHRIIVSAKSGEKVEYKARTGNESQLMSLDELISKFI